ncbi:MAG: DUF86 domain-containing protein [Thermoanaerobaculia bacterium]
MSPSQVRQRTVAEKASLVREMLGSMATLPLASLEAFTADPRMVAAGESYLRRGLEALLDLGRHLLAKGFGQPVAEYAAIAEHLEANHILDGNLAATLREMARYRNRMVRFYDEIGSPELFIILAEHRGDLERVLAACLAWIVAHPERVDRRL